MVGDKLRRRLAWALAILFALIAAAGVLDPDRRVKLSQDTEASFN